MVLLGPDIGGKHPFLRHRGDHAIEVGTCVARPLGERPISEGDLIVSQKGPGAYEVRHEASSHKGPAQVCTPAYAKGWDGIFGKTQVGQA